MIEEPLVKDLRDLAVKLIEARDYLELLKKLHPALRAAILWDEISRAHAICMALQVPAAGQSLDEDQSLARSSPS